MHVQVIRNIDVCVSEDTEPLWDSGSPELWNSSFHLLHNRNRRINRLRYQLLMAAPLWNRVATHSGEKVSHSRRCLATLKVPLVMLTMANFRMAITFMESILGNWPISMYRVLQGRNPPDPTLCSKPACTVSETYVTLSRRRIVPLIPS